MGSVSRVLTGGLFRRFWLSAFCLVVSGCAFVTTYNPAYIPNEHQHLRGQVPGKVLIYTERADDLSLFRGNPTSFTGSASTLTIPLGTITKEVAVTVFGDMFKDGFDISNSLDPEKLSRYSLVIQPRTTRFSYEYNQAKNIGFAITPTVTLSLDVKLLDREGKPYWEKTYESGIREAPAYMISGSPGEEISKLAHATIYALMVQAATDVRSNIASQSQAEKAP